MTSRHRPLESVRILVATHDQRTRTFLADNLTADGAVVHPVPSCGEALRVARHEGFDLVVADVNGDTLDLLDWIHTRVPCLVLAAADELTVIRSLQRGADDVMGKPFSYPELVARAGAVLRRQARRHHVVYVVGDLRVDLAGHQVRIGGDVVPLSRKSFELVALLAEEPTRVFTKAEIIDRLWPNTGTAARTLDSHACRTRLLLTRAGLPHVIENIWGVGYKLCNDPAALLMHTHHQEVTS